MSFENLGLHEALTRAVADAGYDSATDVQQRAIPPALAGRDLMVSASTGSGKTASFILPALQRVLAARGDNSKRREKGVVYGPRILVLAPTRELAMQVAKAADSYGRHPLFLTEEQRRAGSLTVPANLLKKPGKLQVWLIGEHKLGRLKLRKDITTIP